jgi:lipoprotein-releasing system permease protein
MIGILKALGATNRQIRGIFIYKGILLVIKGMGLGNVIGLGFCAIQYFFRIIPLDPDNYYMSSVPIEWDLSIILLLNVLVFFLISSVLILPTIAITKVQPIRAIRFD